MDEEYIRFLRKRIVAHDKKNRNAELNYQEDIALEKIIHELEIAKTFG